MPSWRLLVVHLTALPGTYVSMGVHCNTLRLTISWVAKYANQVDLGGPNKIRKTWSHTSSVSHTEGRRSSANFPRVTNCNIARSHLPGKYLLGYLQQTPNAHPSSLHLL